ncbi:hypothetical protein M413DRAFT_449441 [Hebeloma cylindrosporum]|uniref:Uncharacterized protein n=1 Tax=Hebeloma cylindrosporum TaxID=76867 RepID=A0A0C3BGX3_HEBCY|nr:hypothetical protein M413DRAFT_449441 [Hebeloma cylindrosporum h7]
MYETIQVEYHNSPSGMAFSFPPTLFPIDTAVINPLHRDALASSHGHHPMPDST